MGSDRNEKKSGCLWFVFRWVMRILGVILILLTAAFLIVFSQALYNRFYRFPQQAKTWEQLKAQRSEVTLNDGLTEYRGVLHCHSELSHDSATKFPYLASTMKEVNVDFICMTDHYESDKADYSLGWNGMHDGILFIRGYELDKGLMPWGVPEGTVFMRQEDPTELAKKIRQLGAFLSYSHCEHKRDWDLPELQGMEVYNIHPDLMDEKIPALAPDLLLNLWSYGDQTLRLVFDVPTDNLKRWDELNKTRKITGFAANDAHNNVGIRFVYDNPDLMTMRGTGEKTEIENEFKLNWFSRLALRVFFGKLEPGKQLLRIDLDPLERSCRFVNTHILAKELTEKSVLDALTQGRCFWAYNMIADAKGFKLIAEGPSGRAVMGESIVYAPGTRLRVAAPNACRITVKRHGEKVEQKIGSSLDYEITQPGKYRVEAELDILGEWTLWVVTNPIEVTAAPPAPAAAQP
jgi:hypothetical protein